MRSSTPAAGGIAMSVPATDIRGSPGSPNGLAPGTRTMSNVRPWISTLLVSGAGNSTSMSVRLASDSITRNSSSLHAAGDATLGVAAAAVSATARIAHVSVVTTAGLPGRSVRESVLSI